MRLEEARDAPGYADGQSAAEAAPRNGPSILVEKELRSQLARRGLAEVEGRDLAIRRSVEQETATSQVSGVRRGHGERERRGDRGIDRIQDLLTNI